MTSNFKDEWTDDQWEEFVTQQASGLDLWAQGPLADLVSSTDPRFPLTIDHTLLKPEATPEQIARLCDEALKYGFKSCCVNGIYVPQVVQHLDSPLNTSGTIACCVIGFPLGAGSAEAKAYEARDAISAGALEIDTVIPVGLLLSSPKPKYASIYKHLKTIISACGDVPVKIILETSLIPNDQLKSAACILAAEAGAAFVKTSTGFAGGGATKEDVRLMAASVRYKNGAVKVKASGGVRTLEACVEMFNAGAERIGTSSGTSIMQNAKSTESGY